MANGSINMNTKEITADINKWLEQSENGAEEAVNVVVDDISTNVQRLSPVDTGRFKTAWFVDVISPLRKTIRNTVKYAEVLAMGHSKQAPAGWIDRVIMNALQRFK